MKKYSFLLIFICLVYNIKADSLSYKLILSLPVTTEFFTTDPLGNVYVITQNRLIKYDLNGKQVTNNDEKNLGTLISVDASNPFKVITFYKDYSRVQVLDNKLVPRVDVNLLEKNLQQPLVVAYGQGEGLWVYDQQDFKLKKFDSQFRIITESASLDQVLATLPDPDYLLEAGKWLLMNDPARGILLFDRFGTYSRTIPLKGLHSFQVIDGKIIYFYNTLHSFDLNTLEEKEITLPSADEKINVRIEGNRIYILKKGFLEIYET